MIIFDEADVKSSNKYFIVAERIDYQLQGGFYIFPQEFKDNFMMGFTDFSTQRGQAVFHYNWEFGFVNADYGAFIE